MSDPIARPGAESADDGCGARPFVKTVHQIWTRHPILGDLPAGPRYEIPGIPMPIDRFSFDDILDAHEACILLEEYLRRKPTARPARRKKANP